jgi:hypothetical protein
VSVLVQVSTMTFAVLSKLGLSMSVGVRRRCKRLEWGPRRIPLVDDLLTTKP